MKSSCSRSGFTLIEVLVALVLFSVIIAAVLPGLLMANKTSLDAGNVLNTSSIAQEVVEDTRKKMISAWAGQNSCYKIGRIPLPTNNRLMTAKGEFTVRIEVAPIPTLRAAPGTFKEVSTLYEDSVAKCDVAVTAATTTPFGYRLNILVYPKKETVNSPRASRVSLELVEGSF